MGGEKKKKQEKKWQKAFYILTRADGSIYF